MKWGENRTFGGEGEKFLVRQPVCLQKGKARYHGVFLNIDIIILLFYNYLFLYFSFLPFLL